jgi:2-oxoglutarate dehydrogenase E2 component (dihydrolipoamide succinyltransferase)
MAEKPILVPKMGESISEATVIRWLKNVGDHVAKDEPLVEIATDKVDNEIPSTEEGILTKQLFQDGDVVKVGEPIAFIDAEGVAASSTNSTTPVAESTPTIVPETVVEAISVIENQVQAAVEQVINPITKGSGSRFYSPLVMNIASQEGISFNELEKIPGTGLEGRVTKSDVLTYLNNRSSVAVQTQTQTQAPAVAATPVATQVQTTPSQTPATNNQLPVAKSLDNGDEIIQMDRVRKLIADHMVMSMHTSPHVTSFVEADVTNLVKWRDKVKDSFKKREGQNITFTPIFLWAISKAIKDFPMINVSVDGDKIIKKKSINIGMAVAQKNGNLIVPVIKNADSMNLLGLTRAVNELAIRARDNKLSPDEIQGGTYTVTNVGSFGNVFGTPVINQPQVAIMAVGAIRKKPAVLETEHGDVIAIRHMMYLSHSYDHRVVDGALGGMFVRKVADYLEQWDSNTEI